MQESEQGVWSSNLSGRAKSERSVPLTWVTDYSGAMGNTLAPNGFGAHSTRHSWSSKMPKPRAESDNVNVEVSLADLAREGAPED